jgi:hypothetical protein
MTVLPVHLFAELCICVWAAALQLRLLALPLRLPLLRAFYVGCRVLQLPDELLEFAQRFRCYKKKQIRGARV